MYLIFRYNTAVSSLSFSHDGSALAIACSQLDETEAEDPKPDDTIYIRYVTDQETKPKWNQSFKQGLGGDYMSLQIKSKYVPILFGFNWTLNFLTWINTVTFLNELTYNRYLLNLNTYDYVKKRFLIWGEITFDLKIVFRDKKLYFEKLRSLNK